MRDLPEPYLQAEQAKLPQVVFLEEVLQLSEHLRGFPLDLLQQLHVPLVLPSLDTVLQMGPHENREGGGGAVPSLSLLPPPCGCSPGYCWPSVPHCWLMSNFLSINTPTSIPPKAALSEFFSQSRIAPPQAQCHSLGLISYLVHKCCRTRLKNFWMKNGHVSL